jgi:ketosteroid isomerase-like protein
MQRAGVLAVALLLVISLNSRAAESVTCDQASLAKLETDVGSMSGKGKKRAMKQLTAAKKAFDAGDTKRCERIVARIGAGSSKTANAQPARPSIDATNAQFVKEFNSKDAAAAASHYAQDAAAFPPDQAKVEGRENIQKMWQAVIDAGATDLALTTAEVEESGGLAFESGALSLKMPGKDGKPMDVSGKYVVVWKKAADGSWQFYRDIWNTNPATEKTAQ